MRTLVRGLLLALVLLASLLFACGDDTPPRPSLNDVLVGQATCRADLALRGDAAETFDVFVDIAGIGMYAVTVENGDGRWKSVSGPLEDALLDAHVQARKVGKPVRITYGPGLTDAIQSQGGKLLPQDALQAKQTYYATLAAGCTEAVPGTHHPAEGDCIADGARECRVTLLDACDPTAAPSIDIVFAAWDKPDDAGAKACYGVNATGPFAISLPAKDFCQCDVDAAKLRGLYDNAHQLLDAALELRGMDQATAAAVSSGITAAALVNLP